MFYEEKIINGITYYRCTPKGKWRELQAQSYIYEGYEINPDLSIWKDGKRMFEAIPCHSVRDAELLIDSHIMAQDITEKAVRRLPALSSYEIKSLLNEVQ